MSRLCTQAAFSCLDRAGTLAPLRPSNGFFTCHVARSVLASAPPPPPRLGGAESRPWHREVLGPGRSGRAGPAAWRPRGHAGLGRVPSKQVVNVGGDSSWNQDGDRVIAELATARPGPASPDQDGARAKAPPLLLPRLATAPVLHGELPRCGWPATGCQRGAVPKAVAGDEAAQLSVSPAVCSQRKASEVTVPEGVSWTWGHGPGEQPCPSTHRLSDLSSGNP